MLLAYTPENYAQWGLPARENMNPVQSWQGSAGWQSTDMYRQGPATESFFSPEVQLTAESQMQQILQYPGIQVDPSQHVNSVLWPGSGGHWDSCKADSSGHDATRNRPEFTRETSACMSTVPKFENRFPKFQAKEDAPQFLSIPGEKRKFKKVPVDSDFERDVARAVKDFLEGVDSDEEAEAKPALSGAEELCQNKKEVEWKDPGSNGSLSGVPKRTPPATSEVPLATASGISQLSDVDALLANMNLSAANKNKIKSMCAQCATTLQTLPDVQGSPTPETVMVKMLELLKAPAATSGDGIPGSYVNPKADLKCSSPATTPASSKPSLQLESLVYSSSTQQKAVAPELQKGQWLGVMLKNKPLPPGVTAMHVALLKPRVEAIILHLKKAELPSSLSNIMNLLRQDNIGEPLVQAVWNLCHVFPSTFCLWVPDEGEHSLVLLEEPLPPVDDAVADQLHQSLARQVLKKLQALPSTKCGGSPTGLSDANSDRIKLVQELARNLSTTLMIKNLPTSLQQPQVQFELRCSGFWGKYDFFYMPVSFGSNKSLGYAFINLVNVESMEEFVMLWHNSQRFGSTDLLKISAAAIQGREANARHFASRMKRIRNPALRPVILEPNGPGAAETD